MVMAPVNIMPVGTSCGLYVCGSADLQIGSAVAIAWQQLSSHPGVVVM